MPLRQHGTRHLYLGDGSALGTFDAYAAAAQAPLVTVEVPPESVARLRQQRPDYRFLPALDGDPGGSTQSWLAGALDRGTLGQIDSALLLGHAQSIQRQRNALVAGGFLTRRAITTKPYWATGKEGL